jgi:hypothetical protein
MVEQVASGRKWDSFTVEPRIIGSEIASHIIAGQSGQIIIPGRFNIFTALHVMPWWLQETIRNSTSQAMNRENIK